MCCLYLEQLWKWPTLTTASTVCSATQRIHKGWVGQSNSWYVLSWGRTGSYKQMVRPSDVYFHPHYVETSDKGSRGRASVFWGCLRGAWRLFRVRIVEETLARQGLWHDTERTLWLQAGGFLCSTERALWAILRYVVTKAARHIAPRRGLMNDAVTAWPLCVPGEGGVDGDGDITRPENVTAFRNFVLESTERRGLHFLMADGVTAPCFVLICYCRLSPAKNENKTAKMKIYKFQERMSS